MDINIRDHGARGDGLHLDTQPIQTAIELAAANGGGRVIVPPGRYRVGTVFFRDHIHLYLAAGATLVGSAEVKDYAQREYDGIKPTIDFPRWHLLVADGCTDIALTGQGAIDGSGPSFYHPPERELCWPRPFSETTRMRTMVEIYRCRGVVIEDVTLGNVSNWTLHLHESDDIVVRGLRIVNPPTAPNADGIDLTGCRNVRISGCSIDTCDDAICLKTNPRGRSCEDITVDGCVIRTHCVALKVSGCEVFQDMRNIAFSNCIVRGSSRAIGIYSDRGSVVENIAISNIVCDTCVPLMFTRPLHIEAYQRPGVTTPSVIRNILIAGLVAETNGRCLVTAAAGSQIAEVTLRDIQLRYPLVDDPGRRGPDSDCPQFCKQTSWSRAERAALVAENVRELLVDGFRCRWPEGAPADRWLFTQKLANGCHDLYEPRDWELAPDIPFAAASVKQVNGGHIRGPLPSGFQGGQSLATIESDWPVV